MPNELATLEWVTPDADARMAYIARVSSPNQSYDNAARLIQYCIKHQHWSVFEMADMCIEINTSRMLSSQLLRHWSFRFQEFSQRYAAIDCTGLVIYAARRQDDKNRQNSLDNIPENIQVEWRVRQRTNWHNAFEHYMWAIEHGIAKECARAVLPLQTATRLYMKGSIRSWITYITVRTHASAQKEHRDIAEACKTLFIEALPVTAKALGWTQ